MGERDYNLIQIATSSNVPWHAGQRTRTRGGAPVQCCTSSGGAVTRRGRSSEVAIAVIREGTGPEVLLIHGGASPATTWSGLSALSRRWTLAVAHRRGFPPSPPPPGGRQDFEVDAADLVQLLESRPHLVAHSYGGLGALIAATRRPAQVRSLTLLEPALFLPADDPEVARFRRMGEAFLTNGLQTDPGTLREFLKIAGSPVRDDGPLPEEVVRAIRRAHRSRPPGEARPALDVIRDAGIPSLVVSGAHHLAIERSCDALAPALRAERLVAPGAGHFVAAAPGFKDCLEQFLSSAE
jgi:pimeloyl-ACP methyl ester carboxylesterase